PYIMAVEKLAGINTPEPANFIRIMMRGVFKVTNNPLYWGTFIPDAGGITPVVFMFGDRPKAYAVIVSVKGYRMHTAWFRIGGTTHALLTGWERLEGEFLAWMPIRIAEFVKATMTHTALKRRTQNLDQWDATHALTWGVNGEGVRATGVE
ncbi:NADH-quinone oxidoreductase subunit D-related protein, partial [Moraxella catarrhalis]|nr:NADH-quinone oxidoreductase subunit C/D [Moraxella catarrhalis]